MMNNKPVEIHKDIRADGQHIEFWCTPKSGVRRMCHCEKIYGIWEIFRTVSTDNCPNQNIVYDMKVAKTDAGLNRIVNTFMNRAA